MGPLSAVLTFTTTMVIDLHSPRNTKIANLQIVNSENMQYGESFHTYQNKY